MPTQVYPYSRSYILLGLLVIFAYLLPYFILGRKSLFEITDNLDAAEVLPSLLAKSHLVFAPSDKLIPGMLGGIPRAYFGSIFNLWNVLHFIMPTPWALIATATLICGVAFSGMLVLLQYLSTRYSYIISPFPWNVTIAICFAILPYWLPGCLSIAGMPWAVWAFCNLKDRQNYWSSFIALAIYGISSSMITVGIFLIMALGGWWFYESIFSKFSWGGVNGLVLLMVVYLIQDYQLFNYQLFISHSLSQRVESLPVYFQTKNSIIEVLQYLFFSGQMHSYNNPILIWLIILFAFILIFNFRKEIITMSVGLCIITLITILFHTPSVLQSINKIHNLNGFQLDRFYMLFPLFIYLMGWLAGAAIIQKFRWGKIFITIIMGIQILILFYSNINIRGLIFHGGMHKPETPNYSSFFAKETLLSIKKNIYQTDKIDLPIRVGCIAFEPSIALYNDFEVVGGYGSLYSLDYKHVFRKVISTELSKDEKQRKYFDYWGNRCYIFSSEANQNYLYYGKTSTQHIHHLEINTQALQTLGARYIISALPVDNFKELGWEYRGAFEHANEYWRMHLYKIGS